MKKNENPLFRMKAWILEIHLNSKEILLWKQYDNMKEHSGLFYHTVRLLGWEPEKKTDGRSNWEKTVVIKHAFSPRQIEVQF